MKGQSQHASRFIIWRNRLVGASLIFLCGLAGYTDVQYQGASPKGTYHAKVTMRAGPSEQQSWWSMDVERHGQAFISDFYFSPFYAWACVERGKATWTSESVLHFSNFSAQGRRVPVTFQNTTNERVEYAEL